jgi:hypothetical protein
MQGILVITCTGDALIFRDVSTILINDPLVGFLKHQISRVRGDRITLSKIGES